jgi:hypothetical protein
MSVHLKISSLTNEQKKNIKKILTIQPKNLNFSKRAKFMAPPDPVEFYIPNYKSDTCILPYTIGNAICGYNINSKRKYVESRYHFIGKLWKDQIEVADEASKYMLDKGTVTLGLYPGFGKTILSAYLGSKQNGIMMVTYNRTALQVQWLNTFKTFTNAKYG